jgi:hypothetical protein
VLGARKENSGKETGAEAKCQEQVKNLREKRREQKRSTWNKETI